MTSSASLSCFKKPSHRTNLRSSRSYFFVPDPDALAAEFAGRGVSFSVPLKDTHDGLRGFELKDPDGYVLFFGRPAASISTNGQFLSDDAQS